MKHFTLSKQVYQSIRTLCKRLAKMNNTNNRIPIPLRINT